MTTTASSQRIDPITAAVIHGALDSIAAEMGHKLMRMSYSSIIRESEDFGTALTDAQGRQLCECRMSTPLQSGPIPGYIRGIRKQFDSRGDVFRPGDVIMHNDPYGGASHGPDVAFCVPIFLGDQLADPEDGDPEQRQENQQQHPCRGGQLLVPVRAASEEGERSCRSPAAPLSGCRLRRGRRLARCGSHLHTFFRNQVNHPSAQGERPLRWTWQTMSPCRAAFW